MRTKAASAQYKVKVLSLKDQWVRLEMKLSGTADRIYGTMPFVARVLADSLNDELAQALWPRQRGATLEWARAELDRDPGQAILPNDLVVMKQRFHPRIPDTVAMHAERLAKAQRDLWAKDPVEVARRLTDLAHGAKTTLRYEDNLEEYAKGTLEALCEEIGVAQVAYLAKQPSSADLVFGVTDVRWSAHLKVGDKFASNAAP